MIRFRWLAVALAATVIVAGMGVVLVVSAPGDECSRSPVRGVQAGDLRLTTPNEHLNGLDLRGRIYVEAPGITVCNSVIRGGDSGGTGSFGLINNTGGFAGLLIVDTELVPTVPSAWVNGIVGSHFTARRVNIHGVIDGLHVLGDDVVLEDSRIHDHLHYLDDPNQAGTGSHDDSIQIQSGHRIRITGNEISGAFNSGIQIGQGQGSVGDVVFRDNRIDGGGCSVNISEAGGAPIRGLVLRGNVFGGSTRVPGCAVIAPGSSLPEMTDNSYDDGSAVTVTRGR